MTTRPLPYSNRVLMVSPPSSLPTHDDRKTRLERLGRVAGVGFLFALFGVGGLILAGVVIPLAARRGADARALVAQRWIQRTLALYLAVGTRIRIWEIHAEGVEQLRATGQLVIANHPSLLDVVLLLSFMPQADCVVKKTAWSNPMLRSIVAIAGYISNDDGPQLVDACAERLAAGRSVILFPEGSRSPQRGLRAFQRGAAQVALKAGCPILPVRLDCQPPALKRGQPWYQLPPEVLRFSLRVGRPVHAKEVTRADAPRAIAARKLTKWMQDHFESEQRDAVA